MADELTGLVLVTDFDGTLYRGDAPLQQYAWRAAQALPAPARRELLDGLERYLDEGAPAVPEAVDGWEAVAVLARRQGVDEAALAAAFTGTRAYMAGPGCELEVPTAYAELLAELRARGVRVVLATNSPAHGLDPLLERLEVLPLVDEVVSGTGKPAGLERLLRRELGLPPDAATVPAADGARLLVVGDHWTNDIAPGMGIGAVGAYIDRFGRADGPAHITAPLVEGVLDTVRNWAQARSLAERN
ncbi:HAD family hydrolase [Streptacidiphilus sp. PB12-B1b]|uniref:HAD family hydrolase n=1 Tax=Streptacidiphilus sp. PB12-B1b TaxID=2705012 RepID=UPI0015FCA873|nr:HAD family hydrolase [Streptacidiphilus sp. PB12-B1b]QMU75388.1 HAD family hydrolase [Streptacidiphilus sp. PB12-B1b]